MRISKLTNLLLAFAFFATATALQAQPAVTDVQPESRFNVAVTYQTMRSNPVWSDDKFWTQGGSVQVYGKLWRGLGEVVEVSGLHNGKATSSGVGLDIVTAASGPRYTWSPARRRLSAYGHALMGEAFGMNSVFPAASGVTSSAHGFAFVLGGGLNCTLNRRLSMRVLEADWTRTQLPNATTNVQNNLRLGAGVVLRLR